MASDVQRNRAKGAQAIAPTTLPGTLPYALRPLLLDVPLSADGRNENVKINCVEYYGMKLLGLGRYQVPM